MSISAAPADPVPIPRFGKRRCRSVVGEIDEAGLLDATAAPLAGSGEVNAILNATDLPERQAWPCFVARVEEILAASG